MTVNGWLQIVLYAGLVVLLIKPLGLYMARVFNGERTFLDPILRPVERLIYRLCGVNPCQEQHWTTYTAAMLLFNFVGLVALYALQRLQHLLALNPQDFNPPSAHSAFNTAASFTSNTNCRSYGSESTMSYPSRGREAIARHVRGAHDFQHRQRCGQVFAIIPAVFVVTYPKLVTVNVMGLETPESAILSAVIFNALIIIALIPLVLRGIKYSPIGAAAIRRRNLRIYGVGGLIVPFTGCLQVRARLFAGLYIWAARKASGAAETGAANTCGAGPAATLG